MPTNEEGEFELILGNRQLLSVFFIVVILLGLFFTMGYIVGQHSTPLVTADATAGKSNAKPVVVDSPRDTPHDSTRETPRDAPEPAAKAPSEPLHTAPQQPAETPKASPAQPDKAPKAEPAKPEPVKAAKTEKAKTPERKEERKEAPPPASITTPSGTYLQLAATTKREADIMVDVLRQKKFSATTAQVPEKPDLFRVLVGPVAEAQVNKTKTDLQSAGFPGDKSIKRTF